MLKRRTHILLDRMCCHGYIICVRDSDACKERLVLDTFMTAFEVVPLDRKIAVKGGLYDRAGLRPR